MIRIKHNTKCSYEITYEYNKNICSGNKAPNCNQIIERTLLIFKFYISVKVTKLIWIIVTVCIMLWLNISSGYYFYLGEEDIKTFLRVELCLSKEKKIVRSKRFGYVCKPEKGILKKM